MSDWGSEEEIERRNRIRLTFAAYAYEFENHSIMTDDEFDALSRKIRPEMSTGKKVLDDFFRLEFEPDTGMWIRKHPFIHTIRNRYHWYIERGLFK